MKRRKTVCWTGRRRPTSARGGAGQLKRVVNHLFFSDSHFLPLAGCSDMGCGGCGAPKQRDISSPYIYIESRNRFGPKYFHNFGVALNGLANQQLRAKIFELLRFYCGAASEED